MWGHRLYVFYFQKTRICKKHPAITSTLLIKGNISVTIMSNRKITVVDYLREGKSLFEKWFHALDATAAAKITTALYRLEQGNFSNVKSVGGGVMECKIDFGPGYRIYFGREGNNLIILLGGGSKKTQSVDINKAQAAWLQYKSDKRSNSW
jgi:putative addiction module killer protein